MAGSAVIKQGRSANRKHTYFFFWPNLKCLEDDIKENIEQRKTEVKKTVTPEETAVQKLCEFQMKLQQDFFFASERKE